MLREIVWDIRGWLCVSLLRRGWLPSVGTKLVHQQSAGLQRGKLDLPPAHPVSRIMELPGFHPKFAFSPQSLLFLLGKARSLRPTSILEMGSGRSTLLWALHAAECAAVGRPIPSILSIDHDLDWVETVQGLLEAWSLGKYVRLHHRPAIGNSNDPELHGYDVSKDWLDHESGGRAFDFVVIDGPSGGLGRRATLPRVIGNVKPGARIFLDDAGREAETASLNAWLAKYPGRLRLRGYIGTRHWMAEFDWLE